MLDVVRMLQAATLPAQLRYAATWLLKDETLHRCFFRKPHTLSVRIQLLLSFFCI